MGGDLVVSFEVWTGLVAGVFALFVLLSAHWLTLMMWGTLGRLKCYVVGTLLIGVVFGGWCAVTGMWVALVVLGFVVAGAGAGTLLGHGVDHWRGQQMELGIRRGMGEVDVEELVGDGQSRAAGDRDC